MTKYKKFILNTIFLVEEMNLADEKMVEKQPVEKWIRPVLTLPLISANFHKPNLSRVHGKTKQEVG